MAAIVLIYQLENVVRNENDEEKRSSCKAYRWVYDVLKNGRAFFREK